MKAWIENNRVRDIAPGNPADHYHPDIAAYYSVEVPDGTQNGAELVEGVWVNPAPPEPQEPIPPAPVVPSAVTMRQARLALLGAGLLDDVEAAISALPSPQKEAARIEWEYSQEVHRHNGFVSVLAPMLGMTAEQTDALFVQAATL